MREIFRSMQKEKVKEMKQQLREEGGGGGGRLEKGFVSQCLVHVAGVGMAEGDDVITREKIQVSNFYCRTKSFHILCRRYVPSMVP